MTSDYDMYSSDLPTEDDFAAFVNGDDELDAVYSPFEAQPDDDIGRLAWAISGPESGGRYSALNPHSGATGKYQMMPAYIPEWTKKYYGRELTAQELYKNKEAQEITARGLMADYKQEALSQGLTPEEANRYVAAKWYSGKGELKDSTKPQYYKGVKYPSIKQYADRVAARYRMAGGSQPVAQGPPTAEEFAAFVNGVSGPQDVPINAANPEEYLNPVVPEPKPPKPAPEMQAMARQLKAVFGGPGAIESELKQKLGGKAAKTYKQGGPDDPKALITSEELDLTDRLGAVNRGLRQLKTKLKKGFNKPDPDGKFLQMSRDFDELQETKRKLQAQLDQSTARGEVSRASVRQAPGARQDRGSVDDVYNRIKAEEREVTNVLGYQAPTETEILRDLYEGLTTLAMPWQAVETLDRKRLDAGLRNRAVYQRYKQAAGANAVSPGSGLAGQYGALGMMADLVEPMFASGVGALTRVPHDVTEVDPAYWELPEGEQPKDNFLDRMQHNVTNLELGGSDPVTRQKVIDHQYYAHLLPGLVGGTAAYFAIGMAGPGMPLLAYEWEKSGARIGYDNTLPTVDQDGKVVGPNYALDAGEQLRRREGVVQEGGLTGALMAVGGWAASELGLKAAAGKAPIYQWFINRIFGGAGGLVGGPATMDVFTNVAEGRGFNPANWRFSSFSDYALAGAAGMAMSPGLMKGWGDLYVRAPDGRIGRVTPTGKLETVRVVPDGIPVADLAAIAPEASFDALFEAHSPRATEARKALYNASGFPGMEPPLSDDRTIPDLNMLKTDPDGYLAQLKAEEQAHTAVLEYTRFASAYPDQLLEAQKVVAGELAVEQSSDPGRVAQGVRVLGDYTDAVAARPELADMKGSEAGAIAALTHSKLKNAAVALKNPEVADYIAQTHEASAEKLDQTIEDMQLDLADADGEAMNAARAVSEAKAAVAEADKMAEAMHAEADAALADADRLSETIRRLVDEGKQIPQSALTQERLLHQKAILMEKRAVNADQTAMERESALADAEAAHEKAVQGAERNKASAEPEMERLAQQAKSLRDRAKKSREDSANYREMLKAKEKVLTSPEARKALQEHLYALWQGKTSLPDAHLRATAFAVANAIHEGAMSKGLNPDAPMELKLAAIAEALTGSPDFNALFEFKTQREAGMTGRGGYTEPVFGKGGKLLKPGRILLTEKADASTIIHEFWHGLRQRGLLPPGVDAAIDSWSSEFALHHGEWLYRRNPNIETAANRAASEALAVRGAITPEELDIIKYNAAYDMMKAEAETAALEGVLWEGTVPEGTPPEVKAGLEAVAKTFKDIYQSIFSNHVVDPAALTPDVKAMFTQIVGGELVESGGATVADGAAYAQVRGAVRPLIFASDEGKLAYEVGETRDAGKAEQLATQLGVSVKDARKYAEQVYKDMRMQAVEAAGDGPVTLEQRLPKPHPADSPEIQNLKTSLRAAANMVMGAKGTPDLAMALSMVSRDLSIVKGNRPVGRGEVEKALKDSVPPQFWDKAKLADPDGAVRYDAYKQEALDRRAEAERKGARIMQPQIDPANLFVEVPSTRAGIAGWLRERLSVGDDLNERTADLPIRQGLVRIVKALEGKRGLKGADAALYSDVQAVLDSHIKGSISLRKLGQLNDVGRKHYGAILRVLGIKPDRKAPTGLRGQLDISKLEHADVDTSKLVHPATRLGVQSYLEAMGFTRMLTDKRIKKVQPLNRKGGKPLTINGRKPDALAQTDTGDWIVVEFKASGRLNPKDGDFARTHENAVEAHEAVMSGELDAQASEIVGSEVNLSGYEIWTENKVYWQRDLGEAERNPAENGTPEVVIKAFQAADGRTPEELRKSIDDSYGHFKGRWREALDVARDPKSPYNGIKLFQPENAPEEPLPSTRAQRFVSRYTRKPGDAPFDVTPRWPFAGTDNFVKWFGKSVTVDEHGTPLVWLHGTDRVPAVQDQLYPRRSQDESLSEDFEAFKPSFSDAMANAIFFTPASSHADMFAGNWIGGRNARHYPAYLKAENPFDYENPVHMRSFAAWLKDKHGVDVADPTINAFHKDGEKKYYYKSVERGQWESIQQGLLQDYIKEVGHDGFYVRHSPDHPAKNLAVYKPEQIKSIFNKGTFDPESPKMLEQPDSYEKNAHAPVPGFIDRLKEITKLETELPRTGWILPDGEMRSFEGKTHAFSAMAAWPKELGTDAWRFGSAFDRLMNQRVMRVNTTGADYFAMGSESVFHASGLPTDAQRDIVLDAMYAGKDVLIGVGKYSGRFKSNEVEEAEAFMRNPVGRTTLYQPEAPDTPEFKEWFGDSEIVDDNDKPLAMYTGTFGRRPVYEPQEQGDVAVIDINKTQMKAIYLTPDPATANKFNNSEHMDPLGGPLPVEDIPEGARTYQFWVRAERPFDYEKPIHIRQFKDWLDEQVELGAVPTGLANNTLRYVELGHWPYIENDVTQRFIKSNGYDGYYVREDPYDPVKNLAVFSGDQLKSVYNRGTFSRDDKHILHQPERREIDTDNTPLDTKDFEQIGPRGGSNPGGLYKAPDGTKYYVKRPPSEDHARNEVLAAKLYELAGIKMPKVQLAEVDGAVGVASKIEEGEQAGSRIAGKGANYPGAHEGFAVDAWLANWDTVGLDFDNMLVTPSGEALRIDTGGALRYRAMGGAKGDRFTDYVGELDSLRVEGRPTGEVFGNITPEALEDSMRRVADIEPGDIERLVDAFGPKDADEKLALLSKLLNRQQDIRDKLGDKWQYPEPDIHSKMPDDFDPKTLLQPDKDMEMARGVVEAASFDAEKLREIIAFGFSDEGAEAKKAVLTRIGKALGVIAADEDMQYIEGEKLAIDILAKAYESPVTWKPYTGWGHKVFANGTRRPDVDYYEVHAGDSIYEFKPDGTREYYTNVAFRGKQIARLGAQDEPLTRDQVRATMLEGMRIVEDYQTRRDGMFAAMLPGAKIPKFSFRDNPPLPIPGLEDLAERDLLVVKGIYAEKLEDMLSPGFMAAPSIAVINPKSGVRFSDFGSIYLVFGKETVDPKRDPRNKTYDVDIYSPRRPRPWSTVNEDKWNALVKIKDHAFNLDAFTNEDIKKSWYNVLQYDYAPTESLMATKVGDKYGFQGKNISGLEYKLKNSYLTKAAFALQRYPKELQAILEPFVAAPSLRDYFGYVGPFYKSGHEAKVALEASGLTMEEVKFIASQLGEDKLAPDLRPKVAEFLRVLGHDDYYAKVVLEDTYGDYPSLMQQTLRVLNPPAKLEQYQAHDALTEISVKYSTEFDAYIKNLTEDLIEPGEYVLGPDGDSLLPYTEENVIPHMFRHGAKFVEGGEDPPDVENAGGLYATRAKGMASTPFKSLDEMRLHGVKLADHSISGVAENMISTLTAKATDMAQRDFETTDWSGSGKVLGAAVKYWLNKDYSDAAIKRNLQRYFRSTKKPSKELIGLVREIAHQLRFKEETYFEAKPERFVPVSEIKAALVPIGPDGDTAAKLLADHGITEIKRYEQSSDKDRQRALSEELDKWLFQPLDDSEVSSILEKDGAVSHNLLTHAFESQPEIFQAFGSHLVAKREEFGKSRIPAKDAKRVLSSIAGKPIPDSTVEAVRNGLHTVAQESPVDVSKLTRVVGQAVGGENAQRALARLLGFPEGTPPELVAAWLNGTPEEARLALANLPPVDPQARAIVEANLPDGMSETDRQLLHHAFVPSPQRRQYQSELIDEINSDIEKSGGTSIRPDKTRAKTGYMVAVDPNLTHTVETKAQEKQAVADYIVRPEVARLLNKSPDNFIGAWRNAKDQLVLDVSERLDDFDLAMARAKHRNQDAIYDLDNGETIYVTKDEPTLEQPPNGDPQASGVVADMIREESYSKQFWDSMSGFLRALMLTNPGTLVGNPLSNLVEGVRREAISAGGAPLDMFYQLFSKGRSRTYSPADSAKALKETLQLGDADLDALHRGGMRRAWERFRGIEEDHYQGRPQMAAERKKMKYKDAPGSQIPLKLMDDFSQLIYGGMSAGDALFYTYALKKNFFDLARAEAMTKAKRDGGDWGAIFDDLVENPTDELVLAAQEEALSAVFQNSTAPHEAAEAVKRVAENHTGPFARFALDMVIPFSKTPSSIILKAFDFAGADVLKYGANNIKFFNAIIQGLHKDIDTLPEVLAIQRKMTGQGANAALGGLMWLGILLGLSGRIQPKIPESEVREARLSDLQGMGYRGGRMRVTAPGYGEITLDLNTVGPIGEVLIVAAAVGQEYKRTGELSSAGWKGLQQAALTLLDMPMISGPTDYYEALSSEKKATNLAAGLVTRPIPAVVQSFGRAMDPYERKAEGFTDAVKTRIPFMREDVAPREDPLTGEPMQRRQVLPGALPFAPQNYKGADPVIKVAVDLNILPSDAKRRDGESEETYQARSKRRKEVWRDAFREEALKYGDVGNKTDAEKKALRDQLMDIIDKRVDEVMKNEFPTQKQQERKAATKTGGFTRRRTYGR